MTKVITICFALLIGTTAIASTEVVCDRAHVHMTSGDFANGKAINKRVDELEKEGKSVTITMFSTSASGAGDGSMVLDKVCAVLKY